MKYAVLLIVVGLLSISAFAQDTRTRQFGVAGEFDHNVDTCYAIHGVESGVCNSAHVANYTCQILGYDRASKSSVKVVHDTPKWVWINDVGKPKFINHPAPGDRFDVLDQITCVDDLIQ